MTDSTRSSVPQLVAELATAVDDLQRDLQSPRRRRGRGPDIDRLLKFTTDVTIPATILVLETNVRALRLLQRALRLADQSERDIESSNVPAVGRTVVDRIDDAIADVQAAVERSSVDEQTQDQLEAVRDLNQQLEARLEELSDDDGEQLGASVDVDAELESIKQEFDDDGADGDDRTDE